MSAKMGKLAGGMAAILALSGLVAGCGTAQNASASTNNANSSNSSGGGSTGHTPVTLTWFMWTSTPTGVSAWNHVANLVTKKYPWIHIQFETTTFSNYWTKLESEAATGTLPDIISLQSQHTAGFGASFLPLEPLIQKNNFDVSAFNSTIIQGLTYNNKLRAFPYDFGPLVMYYNKALFDKYHVPYPSNNWTYAQFVSDAKALSHGNDYGFLTNPYVDQFLPFALSAGAKYLNSDGSLNVTNSAFVNSLQAYAKLNYQDHYAPQETATIYQNTPGAFDAGNLGMYLDGPWDMLDNKTNAKFKFGIAPIPAQNGQQISTVAGSGFGISKTSKHPNDAFLAISVLTGPTAEQYLASAGRAFAARTADQSYWYSHAVSGSQAVLQYQLQHAVPEVTTSKWNEVQNLTLQYGISVVNGSETAANAMKTVQAQAGGK